MPFHDLPGVTQCRFKRGEYLIRAGEPVEYVYYLLKGTVYREMTSASGHESIWGSKTGDNTMQSMVGVLTLYCGDGVTYSPFDFIARTNCSCYRIPKEVCLQYLRKRPELLEAVIRMAMGEYIGLMDSFHAKQKGNLSGQLCAFLLKRSIKTEQGFLLPKKYTNVEIAKFLSVHKVTVARMLRSLKEQNLIVRTGDGLLLQDVQQLQDYAAYKKQLKYD